jgi:hypothetical protein
VTEPARIVESILIDESELQSAEPFAVFEAVQNFAHWAVSEALLMPGEFPPAALFLANIDFYSAQVANGGHWQFAHNSRMDHAMMTRISNGLHLIGAREHFAIFSEFMNFMAAHPDLTTAALKGDYSQLPNDIKALDRRFEPDEVYVLGEAWVRSLHTFKPLPAADLARAKAGILARPDYAERQAKARAAREAAEAADAKLVAAKALCAMYGLTFHGFTAGEYISGRDIIRWGMRTDKGIFKILVAPDRAELQSLDARTVLAKVRLT